jgi:inactivated superfamily I helicase/RecB family exonuclease
MHTLHIYPTSRALRAVRHDVKEGNGFLPTLMRMDEFERRVILMDGKKQIDVLERILFLREAASFKSFEALKVDRALVRFFTKSEALFRFFEELAAEKVDFDTLLGADAYAEFGEHLAILEQLLKHYHDLLKDKGLTDRAFMPHAYRLNGGFISSYDAIEIHLEGYLSRFELELLEQVAQRVPLIIHYVTSRFNLKMQERFKELGIVLPNDAHVSFSLTDKCIVEAKENHLTIKAQVMSVEERAEQIALAFMQIEKMVTLGIEPSKIVLVLPDESFKEQFVLFDAHKNLNFAMGFDYSQSRAYRMLEALYGFWKQGEEKWRFLLEQYGFELEQLALHAPHVSCEVGHFFAVLESLGIANEEEELRQHKAQFSARFTQRTLSLKEWLFLWLKTLSKISVDDVRGGKITVMGVLETRGVQFDGVVIVDFNEGIVPATSSKDQFLNSSVRSFAGLPTKNDREALQKQYYKRILEQAKVAVIVYSTADNSLPSKFLFELGLSAAKPMRPPSQLFYAQPAWNISQEDPIVHEFDAHDITWSASRLKTFLACKRKYYYRYITKIEAKKEKERNEGSFLHTLLEQSFKEHTQFTSTTVMQKEIDRQLEILLPFEDAKTAYQKLLWREKLQGFVLSQVEYFAAGWRVVECEKEVKGKIGGLEFKGRIDRIDQNETHTLVLDYKSGSTAEAQKTKNIESVDDLQMSIYHQLLSSTYPNISLAFVKLFDEGKMEEITALEEKNQRLGEVIIELKQIKSFVASKCEDLQKCKWCEFALMCERGEYL